MLEDDDDVVVYTTADQLSAESIRLLLESFGIPSFTSQESVGRTTGLIGGPFGEVEILVPHDQALAARQVLDSLDRGELSLPDNPQS